MKRSQSQDHTSSKRICIRPLSDIGPSDTVYSYEQVRLIVAEAVFIRESQLRIEMDKYIQELYEQKRSPPEYIS
jgi:hypothetical protein